MAKERSSYSLDMGDSNKITLTLSFEGHNDPEWSK